MTLLARVRDRLKGRDTPYYGVFSVMLVFGFIGLAASFVLSVEKIHLLLNPDAVLSCSINLVLNCSTVMQTWQSQVFGFPNMFIGLIGFPIVITIALLGLSRVAFPRWFAVGMEIGVLLWTLFAYWLFFSSIYVIQVLCPWCLIVTFSMTMLLAATTYYTVSKNSFGVATKPLAAARKFVANGYYQLVIASWVAIMVALVIIKFGTDLFG